MGLEFYPPEKILMIEKNFPADPIFTYSKGNLKIITYLFSPLHLLIGNTHLLAFFAHVLLFYTIPYSVF